MKWALHTGKFVEGRDDPDPKKWKANFRCAINSLPDVEELSELSRKIGPEAYRVYQLKEEKSRRSKCRRFTGRHVGKGSRLKNLNTRRTNTCRKNYINTKPVNHREPHNRVPSTTSPASPSYSEGVYSPGPSESPSSSSTSESSTPLIIDLNPHSPLSDEDHYIMEDDSPLHDPHYPFTIGSECVIANEDDDEILEAVANIQDPETDSCSLPDIKTLFASLDATEVQCSPSESFTMEYTELSPALALTKNKIQEHNQLVFC